MCVRSNSSNAIFIISVFKCAQTDQISANIYGRSLFLYSGAVSFKLLKELFDIFKNTFGKIVLPRVR